MRLLLAVLRLVGRPLEPGPAVLDRVAADLAWTRHAREQRAARPFGITVNRAEKIS